MDELILSMHSMTQEMANRLEQATEDDLTAYVEERGLLFEVLEEMTPTLAEKARHAAAIQDIMGWDRLIVSRMEELKQEVASKLHRMNTSKMQRTAYQTDYAPDSLFFDRRK